VQGLAEAAGCGGSGLRVTCGLQPGGRGQLRQQLCGVDHDHPALRVCPRGLWQVGADLDLAAVKPRTVGCSLRALQVLVADGGHAQGLHAARLRDEGGAEFARSHQPHRSRGAPGWHGKPLEDGFEIHG
jgi:hypothetical protein